MLRNLSPGNPVHWFVHYFALKMDHNSLQRLEDWAEWIDGLDEEGSHGFSRQEWHDWWKHWWKEEILDVREWIERNGTQAASSSSERARGEPVDGIEEFAEWVECMEEEGRHG